MLSEQLEHSIGLGLLDFNRLITELDHNGLLNDADYKQLTDAYNRIIEITGFTK
jgi:hypothetical protein